MHIVRKISTTLMTAGTLAFAASSLSPVPSANTKTPGFAAPNILSPELREIPVAQGSNRLENPSALTSFYGYDNNGPMLPLPGDVQSTAHNVEATKTEPDKNTYLILKGLHGADPNYNYGTHFLFQGHEKGQKEAAGSAQGYITRINLDADGPHRVTLLATAESSGKQLPAIDGSTWYPFAQRLLFTCENGASGGVWQATPDYPSTVEDISGVLGRGGYEGIQADPQGNLIIIEDVGGASGSANSHAKQPNSFVYRFQPKNPANLLSGGRLQVLQVMSKAHAGPIVFHAGDPDGDIKSQDTKDLHTYGLVFQTNWITIHDTDVQGNAPFDANASAKAAGGTPFKRPENGQFRPGSHFREFYFDETGDTNALTEAGVDFGGFGAIQKLTLNSKSNTGTLTLFFKCDVEHSSLDNVAFWSNDEIVFVQDAGDTLHTQSNALDSAYLFDLRANYGNPNTPPPIRILAQGRDASATVDSGLISVPGTGFQNDADNEITGWHVSDGDSTVDGLLGGKNPAPFKAGWRVFYTGQHGDNFTWEIIPTDEGGDKGKEDN
jgi:hypothetical protein